MACVVGKLLYDALCYAQANELLLCTASEEHMMSLTEEEWNSIHRVSQYLDTCRECYLKAAEGV